MADGDWLPRSPEEFSEWIINFNKQLPGTLATKYGISAATLTQLDADTDWSVYWVQAKLQTEMQKTQVNDYYDTITTEPNDPQPVEPKLSLPPDPPPAVPPGVRKRIRDIASAIKGQKAIYNQADGELLGIVGGAPARSDNPKPTFDLETLTNFALRATFKKSGYKLIRFEFQHKGGGWNHADTYDDSPAEFKVEPAEPGKAEQIFIRATYIEKNKPVGEYSDIKAAMIAP